MWAHGMILNYNSACTQVMITPFAQNELLDRKREVGLIWNQQKYLTDVTFARSSEEQTIADILVTCPKSDQFQKHFLRMKIHYDFKGL